MIVTKKQFDEFTEKQWKRLESGNSIYRDIDKDMTKEATEELLDFCNYVLMLNLQLENHSTKEK